MPPDIVPSRRQRPHKHVIGKGHQTACSERKRCELRKQSHRNPTLRYISTPCRHRKEALHAPIISRKGFTVKSEKVCRRPASTRIAVDRPSRFLPIVPRSRLARLCLCGRRAARQNHDCRNGPYHSLPRRMTPLRRYTQEIVQCFVAVPVFGSFPSVTMSPFPVLSRNAAQDFSVALNCLIRRTKKAHADA